MEKKFKDEEINSSNTEDGSGKNVVDDEDDYVLDVINNVKEIYVDSSKEDNEKKYAELKEVAGEYSRLNASADFAGRASVEGLDFKEATQKETDIVRAYFQSDAFRQRVISSFGYGGLDEMPPRDRQDYERIMDNAKELVSHLKVCLLPSSLSENLGPMCYPYGEDTIVLIDPNDKEGLGLSTLAHEMAHHLYNNCCVNPGIRGDEMKYGVKDSPLYTINESVLSEEGIRRVYKDYDNQVSALAAKMDLEDAKKIAKAILSLHDGAGKERAADVHGVRLMMLQEGIWNPFTGEPVTEKQIEEFRKAHPDSRIFEYWSNKEAAYYLNNIAMSDKVKPDDVHMGYGDDGRCHLVATVGGATVDKVISQRDYEKLLALDEGKRGVLMSRLLGGEACPLDFSEGVPLDNLLAKYDVKPSKERTSESNTVPQRQNVDCLAMSSGIYENLRSDLDEGQMQRQQRGMSV